MNPISFIKPFRFALFILVSFLIADNCTAQASKENTTDLSKASRKGLLNSVILTDAGLLNFTYGMRVDKKSEDLLFEAYSFDADLNFKGMQPAIAPKEINEEKQVKTLAAYAGGSTSFTVLSQKLSLQREVWNMKWNTKKQRYEKFKRISREVVKPKNDEGKYIGYMEQNVENGVFVIASYQPEKKGTDDQFLALFIDMDLNVKETPITTEGNYSLVYSGTLENSNIFVIMAPNHKMPNTSEYIYAEFTPKAELVKRSAFKSPSSNLTVMDYQELDGSLFLCCASTKDKEAYDEVFTNYANISNPAMGISWQDQKYNKIAYKKEMDNFHFLKITKGEVTFASTTPIKSFKDKAVTPPSQKKAHTYSGNRLYIEKLEVLPAGGYLMAGQLLDKDMVKEVLVTKYLDIVGFIFDAKGELRAQFAVDKVNDDTKSELNESKQNFYLSNDGKTAYWEILEVQGSKGYDSFEDAYAGNKTYTYGYFPRVGKIDLATAKVSDFEVLGAKGKYVMYKVYSSITSKDGKSRYYAGHDDDYETLWVGKYSFN